MGVCVAAGLRDDDRAVPMDELATMVADTESFREWQRAREALDGLADVGVVEHGYYRATRRARLTQIGTEGAVLA